jgi:hypothetical protein
MAILTDESVPVVLRGLSLHAPAENASMVYGRRVLAIPPLLVMLLKDLDRLPKIPNEPDPTVFGYRFPSLAEMEAVTWIAEWESRQVDDQGRFIRPAGLAAYRDVYDYHTASDVREVVLVAGSRRAVVAMTRWMIASARASGRRLIGAAQHGEGGDSMVDIMESMGGRVTRVVVEYMG